MNTALVVWTVAAFLLLAVIGYTFKQKPRIGCREFLLAGVVLLVALGAVYVYAPPIFIPVAWGGLIGFIVGTILALFF